MELALSDGHHEHHEHHAVQYYNTLDRLRHRRGQIIPIRLASGTTELESIYRFRYQIYVEEMNRGQIHADHLKKLIEDPLGSGGYNFAAFRENEVVGVLRVNFPRSSNVGYYENFLDMRSVGELHPHVTSICTGLMVAQRFRNSSLAMRLAQASYQFGLCNHIRFNFLDCDDHLIGFFTRLGYIFSRHAEHPEYGLGNVMRLDLLDLVHLTKVRSPFLAIFDRKRGKMV